MKGFDLLQALWLALLLSGALYASSAHGKSATSGTSTATTPDTAATTAPLTDASGKTFASKHYERIASSSGYADELLFALSEPERIVALSSQGHRSDRDSFRYGSRPLISGPGDVERLLSLRVDLLLINHFGAQSDLSRMRERGVEVFDLGEMRGLATLESSIRSVSALLGDPTRGERLWRSWSRELDAVARDIPHSQRKAALYLAIYANKLYGGTRGTSYHDVLNAAGLTDLAETKFRDWPQYDPEQLLTMDPPLIVTEDGMADQICNHAWLRSLHACTSTKDEAERHRSRYQGLVEISRNLMGSAGLGMLDAALELREQVYPPK